MDSYCYVVTYESYSDCGDETLFLVDKVFLDENEAFLYALEKNKCELLDNQIEEEEPLDELIFLEQLMNDTSLSNEEKLRKYIRLYDYSGGNLKYMGAFFEVHRSSFTK